MVGELMTTLKMSWAEICGLGFFEGHALYDIAVEMSARTEHHLGLLLDKPHSSKEYRDMIDHWTKSRQPRGIPDFGRVPDAVAMQLGKVFNNG